MDNLKLESKIEAILFYKNEPLNIKKLGEMLKVEESQITEGLNVLRENLKNRGVSLIEQDGKVALVTSKEASALIEEIAKEEMSREIGKAGLETLAIILYNNGASRREIDYIRGVNSTFILRNLAMRGLVEKTDNPKDPRGFLYKPSIELLAHIGILKLEELPRFDEFKAKLESAVTQDQNE